MKDWYNELNRAPWSPPSWVFGVVWPILYMLMGVSLLLVWSSNRCKPYCRGLLYFFVQLGFNLVWTSIFFEYRMPRLALLDLWLTLVFSYLTYIKFTKINNIAGLLLIPYIGWLCLALTLNGYIVMYNE